MKDREKSTTTSGFHHSLSQWMGGDAFYSDKHEGERFWGVRGGDRFEGIGPRHFRA